MVPAMQLKTQALLMHLARALTTLALPHTLPHAPQFCVSPETSCSRPSLARSRLQSPQPVAQPTPQLELAQTAAVFGLGAGLVQTLPHMPQLCGSLVTSTSP